VEGSAIEAAAASVSERAHSQLVAMAENVLGRDPHALDDCIRLAALAWYLSGVMDDEPENTGERLLQALVTGVVGLAETENRQ